MRVTMAAVAVGLGLAVAGPLSAQGRPIELGLDAGFSADLKEPKYSSIEFPIQQLRVGFFVSDMLEIEPALSFNWIKFSGEDATTLVSGTLGVLFHFSADASGTRVYVRPLAGISHVAPGGNLNSTTAYAAGAGLGVKVPIPSAAHFEFRLEGGYVHGFKNDVPASDIVQLLVGFSFLTK